MKKALIVTAFLAMSGAVFANPVCNAPKEKWIKETDIKMGLWKQGYTIKAFTVSQGCYAITVADHTGKSTEIILDPSTGAPIDE